MSIAMIETGDAELDAIYNDTSKKNQEMSLDDFCDIIGKAVDRARLYGENDLSPDRQLAEAYYEGEVPDLAVTPNRSRMVSNDLRAVIAKVKPAVMRTFFGSPRIVDYLAEEEEASELLEIASDRINEEFVNGGGYQTLESAVHDALIQDEGAIRYRIGPDGITFESVPPEQLIIEPDARDWHKAALTGSWTRTTRSDLVAEGFDRAKIEEAQPSTSLQSEADSMRALGETVVELGDAAEEVDAYEVFARIDFDGDGIAELRRVVYVEKCEPDTLLVNEVVSRPRIFGIRAECRPHSWRGRGLARDVIDIQRAKTALLRAAMDNLSAINDPTTVIDMTGVINPDDILQRKRGAYVLIEGGNASTAMNYIQVPMTATACFEAMKYYDEALVDRTGISGAASGMLPDVLQGQTATAVNMIQAGGTARVELICRNVAETGLKPLFESVFLDLCEMGGLQVSLKETTVSVGLGSGTKERDMMALMQILNIQERIIAGMGADNPFVTADNLANTLHKMVEVAGLRTPETYFTKPSPEEVQQRLAAMQNQPNPEQMKLDAQMQLEQVRMQREAEKERAQGEADIAVKQAEADRDAQKTQLEAQLRMQESEARMQIEREKMALQERLAEQKMRFDLMLAQSKPGGEMLSGVDEMGEKTPSALEAMLAQVGDLASQIAMMQQALMMPKTVTTPDGRQYVMQPGMMN